MLIGICGAICAGKHSIAKYLIENHGFKPLYLDRNVPVPLSERSANKIRVPSPRHLDKGSSFDNVDALREFVTQRWNDCWVTTDIWDDDTVEKLSRRPFFMLISVDAPVSVRWNRFRERCKLHNVEPPTLEQFVIRNDEHLYNQHDGLARLIDRAQVRIVNASSSLANFYRSLNTLDLVNQQRLRPSWDQYFMELASLAAQRSNCMKRRVGCVLVQGRRVISTGYNGTPRGITNCIDGGCPRCNSGQNCGASLATCLCLHAEENALLEAGRERIRSGSILYCDTCPCLTCSVKIVQVGISEVVYSLGYSMDAATANVLSEGGVKLRQFSPPQKSFVDLRDDDDLSDIQSLSIDKTRADMK